MAGPPDSERHIQREIRAIQSGPLSHPVAPFVKRGGKFLFNSSLKPRAEDINGKPVLTTTLSIDGFPLLLSDGQSNNEGFHLLVKGSSFHVSAITLDIFSSLVELKCFLVFRQGIESGWRS